MYTNQLVFDTILVGGFMKHRTSRMVRIYELTDACFMGFPLTKDSRFTFHHCIKKEYGGSNSIDNGAVLTNDAHRLLNYIEMNYYEIYYQINCKLIEISKGKHHPTKEQLNEINELIRAFRRLEKLDELENSLTKKYLSKQIITL